MINIYIVDSYLTADTYILLNATIFKIKSKFLLIQLYYDILHHSNINILN